MLFHNYPISKSGCIATDSSYIFTLFYYCSSLTSICIYVPEETGLQIRRRRHCGNVCNRFAFGCCGKVCLWGVGNLFSMPHECTFPWQPNRLCTFPWCFPCRFSTQVLLVAPINTNFFETFSIAMNAVENVSGSPTPKKKNFTFPYHGLSALSQRVLFSVLFYNKNPYLHFSLLIIPAFFWE